MINQQIAVERIIQNLGEPLSDQQFITLCASLQVTDEVVVEGALDWLSVCGLLLEERPVTSR